MVKLPKWMVKAVEPTSEEVAQIVNPLSAECVQQLADCTAPLDEEVNRLLMSRRRVQPARVGRLSPWWVGTLSLAAALTVMVTLPQNEPVQGEMTVLPLEGLQVLSMAQVVSVGPHLKVKGEGVLVVLASQSTRTEVRFTGTQASFFVQTAAITQAVTVHLDDEVSVESTGAHFEVEVDENFVHVNVASGEVLVSSPDGRVRLKAGRKWRRARISRRVARAQSVPEEVRLGRVESPQQRVESPQQRKHHKRLRRKSVEVQASPDPQPLEWDEATEFVTAVPEVRLTSRVWPRQVKAFDRGERSADLYSSLLVSVENAEAGGEQWTHARSLSLLVQATLEPTADTLDAIEGFLSTYPKSTKRLDLIQSSARLADVSLGDCHRAIPAYEELVVYASNETETEAMAHLGLCWLKEGETKKAAKLMSESLWAGLSEGALRDQVVAKCERLWSCRVPRGGAAHSD